MTIQIKTWGNSLAIRLSKEITDQLKLSDGSSVGVAVKGRSIVLRPVASSKKKTLKDLIAGITNTNRPEPIDWGIKRGKELW